MPSAAALAAVLARLSEHSALDPFSNPILLFVLDLNRRIDASEVTLDRLEQLVQQLTADAFHDRAARLGSYLGETDSAANKLAITAFFEKVAEASGFTGFRDLVERAVFGVVFTAHPTFSTSLEHARALAELATGQTRVDGRLTPTTAPIASKVPAAFRIVRQTSCPSTWNTPGRPRRWVARTKRWNRPIARSFAQRSRVGPINGQR